MTTCHVTIIPLLVSPHPLLSNLNHTSNYKDDPPTYSIYESPPPYHDSLYKSLMTTNTMDSTTERDEPTTSTKSTKHGWSLPFSGIPPRIASLHEDECHTERWPQLIAMCHQYTSVKSWPQVKWCPILLRCNIPVWPLPLTIIKKHPTKMTDLHRTYTKNT